MLSLYLLRHGQTDCSLENRCCGGDCEVSLNEAGREAAHAVAQDLAGPAWQAIYSSPQKRALQTVEAMAGKVGLPIIEHHGFAEMRYGAWDGKTPDQIRAEDATHFEAWLANPAAITPPGGESAKSVAARVMETLETIRTEHTEGNVLVASHKTTIRVLLCALLGIDVGLYRARLAQPLASVSMVTFRDTGPRLDRLGDVSHLPLHLRYIEGS